MLYYIRWQPSPTCSNYLLDDYNDYGACWGLLENNSANIRSFQTKKEAQEVIDANCWDPNEHSIVNSTFINNLKKKLKETGSCDELFTLSSDRKWFEDYHDENWIDLTAVVKAQLMLGVPLTDMTILDEKGKKVPFTLAKIELTY